MVLRALFALSVIALIITTSGCGNDLVNDSSTTSDRSRSQHNSAYLNPNAAYNYFVVSHNIQYDQDYLNALSIRARAMLVFAQQESRRTDAEISILRQTAAEITKELRRLDKELHTIEKQRSEIVSLGRLLEKVTTGVATKEALTAIRRFAILADLPIETWTTIEVGSLPEANFRSRGGFIVRDGQIFQNQINPFAGGNLLEYMDFLAENRQDILMGSEAHKPLLKIYDEIKLAGQKRLSDLSAHSDEIALQKRATWEPLITMISALEAQSES